MNGTEINIDRVRVSLRGVIKGEATPVAIMVAPTGNCFIKGADIH